MQTCVSVVDDPSVASVSVERTPAALPLARNSSSTRRHVALDCNFSGVVVTAFLPSSSMRQRRLRPKRDCVMGGIEKFNGGRTFN